MESQRRITTSLPVSCSILSGLCVSWQLIGAVFFTKSARALPYINAPYRRPRTGFDALRAKIINIPDPVTNGKKIDLAPWPEYISKEGIVKFTETGRPECERMRNIVCKPDIVILATGYKLVAPFLDKSYPTCLEADRRGIWKTGDETVGFIGFMRPSLGAIPPLSELQAQLWIQSILNRLPSTPPVDFSYSLCARPNRPLANGVDHDSYAYQLALDIGSAPTISQVMKYGYKTTITWGWGPNFNTKFRLEGPWKWDGAKEIMDNELWDIVHRSPGWLCKSYPQHLNRVRPRK